MSVTSPHNDLSRNVSMDHSLPQNAGKKESRASSHVFIFSVCVFCGSILAVDVFGEALAAISHTTSAFDWGHILIEFVATGLLSVAAHLTYSEMKTLRVTAKKSEEQLHHLRVEFDTVLHERFEQWNLSKSEIDVALLTVRGLSICRIAELRHTQQGTIKAQLSAIFRKAGVSSRTELLAMFMDELLDFGSQPQEKGHPLKVAS